MGGEIEIIQNQLQNLKDAIQMNFTNIDRMNEEVYHHAHVVVKWQLLCQIFMVSIEMRNTIIPMRNTIIPIQTYSKREINK